MEIRKATIKDLDSVANLFDLYRQFYEQPADKLSAKEFLSARLNKKESVIFLAEDEISGDIMGFVQLYPSFSSVRMKQLWILNDLFVHEDHRRKGIAEALMRQTREYASETKAGSIILETQRTNTKAQKLYDKLGYMRDDEHFYFFLETETK